jgi:hypothetical protein
LSTKQEHVERAEHNEFLIKTLNNPFWDWAVTATFYAALHYIEAYLSTRPYHSSNHEKRDNKIQTDSNLKPLWSVYRELKNESKDARYQPEVVFGQADVLRVATHLEVIKRTLKPLIATPRP